MPQAPTLKIFYGPPGTGKTYAAAREAVRVVDGSFDEGTVAERHRQLVSEGLIRWVTFHPSYAYEDFIEGYRPRVNEDGNIVYVPVDGPFKKACAAARTPLETRFRVGQVLGRYEVVYVNEGGVALRSRVVREDRVSEFQHTFVDFWTIERFQALGIPPEMMSLAGPRVEEKQRLARELEIPSAFWASSPPYRAVYEEITRQQGGALETRPVVLVIDEINRADLSRVFGELFTLLEVDKREGGAEEARVILPYSGEMFSVPMALSVVGTMNTADRSLAVVDVALRRRFEFEEVEPQPALCGIYAGINLEMILGEWNSRITLLRSRDYRIGHAELLRTRLELTRQRAGWNGADGELRALAQTVRKKILPLLLEYFPDSWRKADFVLGRGQLLEHLTLGGLAQEIQEALDLDLGDDASFAIPAWWDAVAAEWDPDRFRQAISLGAGVDSPPPASAQEASSPLAGLATPVEAAPD